MADEKRKSTAVIVTDAAVLAYIREAGIADPDEIRRAIACAPGVIGAARLGKRSWTVGPLTFHINSGPGLKPAVTSVTSGPTKDLSGSEMSRLRYNDRGNNHLGRRDRSVLKRKPKGEHRPASPPTQGEYDDDE